MITSSIKYNKNQSLFLIIGQAEGKAAWYYLQVDKLKLPLYRKASLKTSINLTDFGKIIASGWGDSPPQDIQQKMENKD